MSEPENLVPEEQPGSAGKLTVGNSELIPKNESLWGRKFKTDLEGSGYWLPSMFTLTFYVESCKGWWGGEESRRPYVHESTKDDNDRTEMC